MSISEKVEKNKAEFDLDDKISKRLKKMLTANVNKQNY